MKIFRKKNLSDKLTQTISETNLDNHHLSSATVILGIGVLAGLGFYYFNKLRKTEIIKTNDNIIIHTTKLEN
ncbi:MAG: hypothetical protein ACRDCW_08605 [Sarcina sp.]